MGEKKKYVDRQEIIDLFRNACEHLKTEDIIDEVASEKLFNVFEKAKELDYIEVEFDDSKCHCPYYKENKRLKYIISPNTGKPETSYVEKYGVCEKEKGFQEVKCEGDISSEFCIHIEETVTEKGE